MSVVISQYCMAETVLCQYKQIVILPRQCIMSLLPYLIQPLNRIELLDIRHVKKFDQIFTEISPFEYLLLPKTSLSQSISDQQNPVFW